MDNKQEEALYNLSDTITKGCIVMSKIDMQLTISLLQTILCRLVAIHERDKEPKSLIITK